LAGKSEVLKQILLERHATDLLDSRDHSDEGGIPQTVQPQSPAEMLNVSRYHKLSQQPINPSSLQKQMIKQRKNAAMNGYSTIT